ncbi:opioid growth factor receptor-related protein [Shewanella marina]|uniref:opioid growth factor receptor-related protein n=1 Tax=Shewanella marina TaxID=487319 RepID=UPI0004711A7C|nr:opioid growth factor receptor-related protein [Shewanella marina]
MNNPTVDFMLGKEADAFGRHIAQLQNFDHFWLEYDHKYIQMLFPMDTGSKFNKHAALITDVERALFAKSPELRVIQLRSFDMMLDFYGLQRDGKNISAKDELSPKSHDWLKSRNHNQLRITRIIRSLALLGQFELAQKFCVTMTELGQAYGDITPITYSYWQQALII